MAWPSPSIGNQKDQELVLVRILHLLSASLKTPLRQIDYSKFTGQIDFTTNTMTLLRPRPPTSKYGGID